MKTVIIYSHSCHSKPVWLSCFCATQIKKSFTFVKIHKLSTNHSDRVWEQNQTITDFLKRAQKNDLSQIRLANCIINSWGNKTNNNLNFFRNHIVVLLLQCSFFFLTKTFGAWHSHFSFTFFTLYGQNKIHPLCD